VPKGTVCLFPTSPGEWFANPLTTVFPTARLTPGYQYRLCPANEPLTEACFQAHPLDFVQDKQAVVFPNGTLFPVKGTFISEGEGDSVS
jgi:hypothetical protein